MSENEGAESATTAEDADEPTDSEGRSAADTDGSDGATVGGEAAGETAGEVVDEDLVERVADADPEQVAREIASLRERADEAEAAIVEREERIEDLEDKLKRKQAEFQNYKKRMDKRREQEKQRATEDLVERLVDVRDNLARALEQDAGVDIRDGVETTLRQFDRVLDQENVEVVEPDPGDEVDPQRHEVLLRVESDQPPGTVDDVHRRGYVMADKVVQTAQVTVAEEPADGADGGEPEDDEAGNATEDGS